jgi:Bifunctional DNA primase/polymerase, N-terminal
MNVRLTIEKNYRENPLVLDAALKMAQRGIHVLPVRQDIAPLTPPGVHDVTTEPEIMERWYRSNPTGVGHGTCQQRSGLGP